MVPKTRPFAIEARGFSRERLRHPAALCDVTGFIATGMRSYAMEKLKQPLAMTLMVCFEPSNMSSSSLCHLFFGYNFLLVSLAELVEIPFKLFQILFGQIFVSNDQLIFFIYSFFYDFENLCNFWFYHLCFIVNNKNLVHFYKNLNKCFGIFFELFVFLFAIGLQKFFEWHPWIIPYQIFHVPSPARMFFHHFNRWFKIPNAMGIHVPQEM